jgi:hypothetical protein
MLYSLSRSVLKLPRAAAGIGQVLLGCVGQSYALCSVRDLATSSPNPEEVAPMGA